MYNNKVTIDINKIMWFLLCRHYALDSFSSSQGAESIIGAKDPSVEKTDFGKKSKPREVLIGPWAVFM